MARKWYIASGVHNHTLYVSDGTRSDWPIRYQFGDRIIVWDYPEIVPQYIKNAVEKLLP